MSRINLLPTATLDAAGTYTSDVISGLANVAYLLIEAIFVRAAGGTSCKVYIQTSLDNGVTWIDIMCFAFTTTTITKISKVLAVTSLTANTTPTDLTLTDNTILDGVIGDQIRAKYVVVGTYTGESSLAIWVAGK